VTDLGRNDMEREFEDSAPDSDVDSGARPVCPHCIEPIDAAAHFCPKCGGPITFHAFTDPIGSIHAAGYGYRQATSGRPNWIVLVGIWIIFAPNAVLALFAMRETVSELTRRGRAAAANEWVPEIGPETPLEHAVFNLLFSAALFAFCVVILWRVTERYRQTSREVGDEQEPDADLAAE
jgi:uncharacterized protein (DUF983 family)